jgi:hypothetical protein
MSTGPLEEAVEYPDSDGEPMADNTEQYERIVLLRENLNGLVADFVAGNLLWYPVRGSPQIRVAPDVLVALGRPRPTRLLQAVGGGGPPALGRLRSPVPGEHRLRDDA